MSSRAPSFGRANSARCRAGPAGRRVPPARARRRAITRPAGMTWMVPTPGYAFACARTVPSQSASASRSMRAIQRRPCRAGARFHTCRHGYRARVVAPSARCSGPNHASGWRLPDRSSRSGPAHHSRRFAAPPAPMASNPGIAAVRFPVHRAGWCPSPAGCCRTRAVSPGGLRKLRHEGRNVRADQAVAEVIDPIPVSGAGSGVS